MLDSLLADASPRWIAGQIVSLIALGLFIAGFANKDDRKLLLILIAANVAIAVQFALLESWVASAMTCIVILRIMLVRKYHRNLYLMSGLLGLTAVTTLVTWHGVSDIPALIAGVLGTIGMFAFRGSVLRWWLFVAAFFWVLSNIVAGSIGGVIAEALVMATNLVTIWRLATDKRRAAITPLDQ
jgi:hypothetical protein